MDQSVENLLLKSPNGHLSGVVHLPEQTPAPVIVCCHGMLSSKESCKYIIIGEEFSRVGLVVVRFDFSGCGGSPHSSEKKLVQARLEDLRSVLNFVSQQPWSNGYVGLLGSSLGGYLSLLAAAEDDGPIKAVVCWATPFDLERIDTAFKSSDDFRKLFPEGAEIGEPQDLEGLPALKNVLVLHGLQDESVPWENAVDIYRRMAEPKRICLLKDGDHRFLDEDIRNLARNLSLDWFRECGL